MKSIKGKEILISSPSSSNLMEHLLSNRNIENIKTFLDKKFSNEWPKVGEMPDIEKGIEILTEAIKMKEIIGVVSDYDVDGLSSTSIVVGFLSEIKANYIVHIPNRFSEGYGLNISVVEKMKQNGAKVLVTLDNGTTAIKEIELAQSYGMKIVILDHHNLQGKVSADAFVNPHSMTESKFKILCASGISFIFIAELNKHLTKIGILKEKIDMNKYVDIAAVGTVCDVMPLIGFNRVLVHFGLEKLKTNPHDGFKYLTNGHIHFDSQTMGFNIGPYINAAGRLGEAKEALEMLMSSGEECRKKVIKLAFLNEERKKIEREITTKSKLMVDQSKKTVCVAGEDFHEGVIGIVAGRIKDMFQKPTCIMAKNEENFKGSLRSIPGFHIGNFVKSAIAAGFVVQGGGHAAAGGVVVKKENLSDFSDYFEDYFIKNYVPVEKTLTVDACLSLSTLNEEVFEILSRLEPYGEANQRPVFLFPNLYVTFFKAIAERHCLFEFTSSNLRTKTSLCIFDFMNTPFEPLRKLWRKVHLVGGIKKSYNGNIQIDLIDAIVVD